MSSLRDKLSKFESQLQSFIEGGTTRIVPQVARQSRIGSSLVAKMQESIILDQDGRALAADTYIVVVDLETARLMGEDPATVDDLLQELLANASASGASFQLHPRIKISVDKSMQAGRFEIMPLFGLQEKVETSTLVVDSSECMPVPEYAFLLLDGNQVFPLAEQVINLGRRSDNQLVIDDLRVSRTHAQIRAINNRFVIFDLDSTGGTYVNKVRVDQSILFPGDVISLAGVDLVYGQDAAYLSSSAGDATQPLLPFPNS